MRSRRFALLAMLLSASAALAPRAASAQYITVYGAPGYTQGVGGYSGVYLSSLNGLDTIYLFRNLGIFGGVNDAVFVGIQCRHNGGSLRRHSAAMDWSRLGFLSRRAQTQAGEEDHH